MNSILISLSITLLTVIPLLHGCATTTIPQKSISTSPQRIEWEAINSLAGYDAFVANYPESELLKQKDQKLSILDPEIRARLLQIAKEAAGDVGILKGGELSLPGILPEYKNVKGVLWRGPFPQVLSWLKVQFDKNVWEDDMGVFGGTSVGSMSYSFSFRMKYPRAQLISPDGNSITFYSHPRDELRFSSGTLSYPTTDNPPMILRGFNTLGYKAGSGVVVIERQGSKSVYLYGMKTD